MTIDKMNEEEKMCLILIKEGKRMRFFFVVMCALAIAMGLGSIACKPAEDAALLPKKAEGDFDTSVGSRSPQSVESGGCGTNTTSVGPSCDGFVTVGDDENMHMKEALRVKDFVMEEQRRKKEQRRWEICARPDPQIIRELLSEVLYIRERANSKIKEAIHIDLTEKMEEEGAHISWMMGELFPEVRQESVMQHSGTIRDFVIQSAAQSGWWPFDLNHNTVRCTVYKRKFFGPTTLKCIVDVVCHDENTISFDFVHHEYHGDFEWEYCSSLYSSLTGREKQSTRTRIRRRGRYSGIRKK